MSSNNNHLLSSLVAAFVRVWWFRLGLRGCGVVTRAFLRMFPKLNRFYIDYPGLGRIDIPFLDLCWYGQVVLGPRHELGLLEVMRRLAPSSPTVWLVGANSGYLAAELFLRLRPGRLELFEPNSVHKRTLESLAALDDRIRVHVMGLSNESHQAQLFVPGGEGSGSSCASLHKHLAEASPNVCGVSIRLEVADALVEAGILRNPDLIVIDVEGHEASVVAGMKATLHNSRPVVVLEHIFISDQALRELTPSDYKLYTVRDPDGCLVAGIQRGLGHNTAILPEERPLPDLPRCAALTC